MQQSRRSKIRAPQSDGSYLALPATRLNDLLVDNRQKLTATDTKSVAGLSGEQLLSRRAKARTQLLDAVRAYSESYVPADLMQKLDETNVDQVQLVLTGHQPEFFHPGVWFKNFLVAKLARACGGISINLIIDNDVCSFRSISVPTGTRENPLRKRIAFDVVESSAAGSVDKADAPSNLAEPGFSEAIPYEAATWKDTTVTQDFCGLVTETLKPLQAKADFPVGLILDQLEPLLLREQSRNRNLGTTIAKSRHLLELNHQIDNLEVPLSCICQQSSFHSFLRDVFSNAQPFHNLYNESVIAYRRSNRIRSQSHPVPNLVRSEDWLEMPFWIWSSESPLRGPLYVRLLDETIELSDLDQFRFELPRDGQISESLKNLEQDGIVIRPRALMTTMFARLFLADLFVHGIGGAKYDELTDQLIEQFYGIRPPAFVTATSTHHLPWGISLPDPAEITRCQQQIRNLKYHAERRIADTTPDEDLTVSIKRKAELLKEIPPRGSKKKWHTELENANRAMQTYVQHEIDQLQHRIEELKKEQKRASLLASREYSFVLHPPALIEELDRISDEAAAKFI